MSLAIPLHRPDGLTTLRPLLGALVSAIVCVLGVAALVPPALAAASTVGTDTATERPSVRLEGTLSTQSLPTHATTSQLSVVNDGSVPVAWTARGTLAGDGATAAVIEVLAPVDGSCRVQGPRLAGWSTDPLAPGGTATVCVHVSMAGATAGNVTPTVTVDARPA